MTDEPKRYQFLKTARGSRDGLTVHTFNKGEVHELDDGLAEQLFEQGVIEETAKTPGGWATAASAPSRDGEAGIPLHTQRIEELVSVARDHYGLEVDSTMTEAQVRKLIEQAKGADKSVETRETKVAGPAETKPATVSETKKAGPKPGEPKAAVKKPGRKAR